jgi:hypothetical protein
MELKQPDVHLFHNCKREFETQILFITKFVSTVSRKFTTSIVQPMTN